MCNGTCPRTDGESWQPHQIMPWLGKPAVRAQTGEEMLAVLVRGGHVSPDAVRRK